MIVASAQRIGYHAGVLDFFVPGVARTTQLGDVVAVGRPGFKRHIPIRKHTAWSAYVGMMAARAMEGRTLFLGPVSVELAFYVTPPKTLKSRVPITRPDLENLYKGLLDQFNGVVWIDDKQVADLSARRRYADAEHQEGVRVRVTEFEVERWMVGRRARATRAS